MPNSNLKICKSCLMLSTRPRITFDEKGFCNACQWASKKKKINWRKREKEWIGIANDIRSKKNNFDIIVPVSGGKDSCYVAYNLKHKYKLNPLFVTINPPLQTTIGLKNLENFIKKGYNLVSLDPDPVLMQKINKKGLTSHGQPYYGWLTAVLAAIFNFANKLGIDLIMYGEDGEVEYGGETSTQEKFLFDNKYVEKIYLSNQYKSVFKNFNLKSEKFFYELNLLKKLNYAHYSYFDNWDPYKNYLFAKEKFDLIENKKSNPATFTNFAQNDQKLYCLHTYLMYLKFGFGRATQDACIEVRRGAMSRDQAISLVNIYDHEFPNLFLKDYLNYYNLEINDLRKIFDKFANKKILEKKNKLWKKKFKLA